MHNSEIDYEQRIEKNTTTVLPIFIIRVDISRFNLVSHTLRSLKLVKTVFSFMNLNTELTRCIIIFTKMKFLKTLVLNAVR